MCVDLLPFSGNLGDTATILLVEGDSVDSLCRLVLGWLRFLKRPKGRTLLPSFTSEFCVLVDLCLALVLSELLVERKKDLLRFVSDILGFHQFFGSNYNK